MALKLGNTMLIHNKDDIEFVTEFPCFLGHPVYREIPNFSVLNSSSVRGVIIKNNKRFQYHV